MAFRASGRAFRALADDQSRRLSKRMAPVVILLSPCGSNLCAITSKAADDMIVDDAGGLHPGIHNHRADELEPALLERH